MASEIRVDKITSLSGVGTISPSPTGVEIAGITTAATLKATTGIVTTLTATTGIVTTLTTNTLTANSTTKVGSGVTLSPDGDIFATGITTVGNRIDVISSENTLGILTSSTNGANLDLFDDDTQSRIRTVDGRLHLYSDFGSSVADSSIRFFVDGSNEKARILSTGGITFNGDTATANALDDYEEGDWTPTFESGSGSITVNAYSVQYGKYVKIGKMVYVEGLLRANVTNNSNGTYDIGGLPFTVTNTPNSTGIIHAKEQSSWTVAPHHFSCMNNTTKARARGGIDVGDSAYTNANSSGFNSGSTNNNRVYFSGWYRVEGA